MSNKDSSTGGGPHLSKLSGDAIDEYRDAVLRKACVLAVEEDEMSVSEARRFMALDRQTQIRVEWGPDEEYRDMAVEWFTEHREEIV